MSQRRREDGGGPCPTCGRPAVKKFAPFCRARCARVDLGRWLGGRYVIPGETTNPPPPDNDDEPPR